jgi:AcrR family transcriptional regulator
MSKIGIPSASADPRARILEAAGRLFSGQGYEKTSLRAVTREAAVNVAAVNYYFGSKEGLILAVLRERLEPMARERFDLLDEVRREHGEGPLPLERIVEAFLRPLFNMKHPAYGDGAPRLRLLGRLYSEMPKLMDDVFNTHLRPTLEIFIHAMAKTLPEVPEPELYWRTHFMLSMALGSIRKRRRLAVISGGLCDPEDGEGLLRRIVAFACAGLRAPVEGVVVPVVPEVAR